MNSAELLLGDFVYEVNEMLEEARDADPQYRLGLRYIAKRLELKLEAFQIDPSITRWPLIDVDEWFAGRA